MNLYFLIVHLIVLILVFFVILLYVLLRRKKHNETCYDKVNKFDRKLCLIHERLDNLEEDIESLD